MKKKLMIGITALIIAVAITIFISSDNKDVIKTSVIDGACSTESSPTPSCAFENDSFVCGGDCSKQCGDNCPVNIGNVVKCNGHCSGHVQ